MHGIHRLATGLLGCWAAGRLSVCLRFMGGVHGVEVAAPRSPLSRRLPSSEPSGAAAPGVGVLVGPEGGFSPAEFALLEAHEAAAFASLGGHILRAETAAMAALAVIACA